MPWSLDAKPGPCARSAGGDVLGGGAVLGAGPSSGQESVVLALWLELSPVDAL